jgi:lactate permease
LFLVIAVDGRRGARQTWVAALTAGVSFGLAQFVASNYISVQLADIFASLVSAGAVVALTRVWSPSEELTADRAAADLEARESVEAVAGVGRGGRGAAPDSTASDVPDADSRGEVFKAYLPYLVIIVLFSVTNITAVKTALLEAPWTFEFDWPGLHVLNTAGDPVTTTFVFNWFPSAGSLMIIAGVASALFLRISAARMLQVYARTYYELRWAIATVMAVLALAYVMNDSGQTGSLGAWLAGAGGVFALLSPIIGWIGVGVTGSDTSSNALFGALQVQTAAKAGLDPVLMAASNSTGGVMGKMISPQNLAIAAAAVGIAGREGDIFRKVIGWSVLLLALTCLIVVLQATPVLSWMVP